ncbi:MAG: hypothetical protein ACI4PQ_02990 [Butyricicoccaceae bacterium]
MAVKKAKPTPVQEVREIFEQNAPSAARVLCEMMESGEMTPTATVSAAKEVLERAVGKGPMTPEEADKPMEIIVKVVE